MKYDEKKVAYLMQSLKCSRDEAIQVIEDDARIDKGEKLFELTDEQKKASKSARQSTRKPTVYKFDTEKRKRPENVEKQNLIEKIKTSLEQAGATDLEIVNAERELTFSVEGVKYKIVLSCPRK